MCFDQLINSRSKELRICFVIKQSNYEAIKVNNLATTCWNDRTSDLNRVRSPLSHFIDLDTFGIEIPPGKMISRPPSSSISIKRGSFRSPLQYLNLRSIATSYPRPIAPIAISAASGAGTLSAIAQHVTTLHQKQKQPFQKP